jgi:L-alanine-DL-glutamate epimerase-like enolase superfamily enzyme
MDNQGFVRIPQEPGLGYKIKWDYIEDNRINSD